MNVEFHIDDFGQVWLFNVDNIWIREKNELNQNYEKIFSKFILDETRNDFKKV